MITGALTPFAVFLKRRGFTIHLHEHTIRELSWLIFLFLGHNIGRVLRGCIKLGMAWIVDFVHHPESETTRKHCFGNWIESIDCGRLFLRNPTQ
jgi:hypothetical protein